MLTVDDAEWLLVGAVVQRADVLADIHAQPRHFRSPFWKAAYQACMDLWHVGEHVDVYAVAERMGAQDGSVQKLYKAWSEVPSTTEARKWAGVVIEAFRLRKLAEHGADLNAAAERGDTDSDRLIDRLEDDLRALRTDVEDAGPWALALNTSAERYEQREAEGGGGGVRFRLGVVDALVAPMRPGQLVIVGARPSVGKTALAVHVAYANAVRGLGTLVVSLEMGREDMEDRFAAYAAGVSLALLSQGTLSAAEKRRLVEAAAAVRVLPVQIGSCSAPTLGQVRGQVRKAMRDPSLSLVIVDYLGLMSGPKSGNREQEVAALSRGLKAMAVDVGLPVLALAQLNRNAESRDGEGNRPKLADLRDSGQIEQDADVVVLLHRDKDKLDLLELIVAKQRNGPTGKTVVECRMETGRLSDLETR